jgi:hypothetical protein
VLLRAHVSPIASAGGTLSAIARSSTAAVKAARGRVGESVAAPQSGLCRRA